MRLMGLVFFAAKITLVAFIFSLSNDVFAQVNYDCTFAHSDETNVYSSSYVKLFTAQPEEPKKLDCPAEKLAVKECQQEWATYLNITPKTKSPSGLVLVLVPPGSFTMGSPPSEVGRNNDESTRQITISSPFFISETEITQSQFFGKMHLQPSGFQKGSDETYFRPNGEIDLSKNAESTESFPVERVSWFDAVEFCNRLSKSEELDPYYQIDNITFNRDGTIVSAHVRCNGGLGYRLPTESEWEYACRGGTQGNRI